MLFLEDCLPILRKFFLRSSLLSAAELEIRPAALALRSRDPAGCQHSLGAMQGAGRPAACPLPPQLHSECSRATKFLQEGLVLLFAAWRPAL